MSGALSPVVQPFLGQAVTVAYLALLFWQRPFERPLHNLVQGASLLMTWLALLVGDSLFNMATSTGAITAAGQDAIGVWLGVTLLLGVTAVVAWAAEGTAREMWATVRKIGTRCVC